MRPQGSYSFFLVLLPSFGETRREYRYLYVDLRMLRGGGRVPVARGKSGFFHRDPLASRPVFGFVYGDAYDRQG